MNLVIRGVIAMDEMEIREKFIEQLKEYNEQLKARIKPFEDGYFNGLSPIEIAELAKKSIRLTCENRRLEDLQQEIKAIAGKEIYMKQNSSMNRILNLITESEEE